MGTQPRDLLIAWLSFLAGDFCEEGRAKKASITLRVLSTAVMPLVGIVKTL